MNLSGPLIRHAADPILALRSARVYHYYILAIEPEPKPANDAESDDDTDDPTILVLGMLGLCLLIVICAGLSFFTRGLELGYSVQLTGVQVLDPSQNPAVSPAFNLTVHVVGAARCTN